MDDLSVAELGRFVVNLSAGYIAEKSLEPVLEPTWRLLKAVLLPLWDPAFGAVRLNLQEHIERERTKDRDFVERLERSLQRGEAAGLVALFVREAAQATTQDRMCMLAAAAAGVFTPDLDSEMRSRVTRAVAQLEPSDVVRLRSTSGTMEEHSEGFVDDTLGPSRAPLEATGCILIRHPATTQRDPRVIVGLTSTGDAVLRALAAWRPG